MDGDGPAGAAVQRVGVALEDAEGDVGSGEGLGEGEASEAGAD